MKAYLVDFTITTRIEAKNEKEAENEAFYKILNNFESYLTVENCEVTEDFEVPYEGNEV